MTGLYHEVQKTLDGTADVILLTVKSQDVSEATREIARLHSNATVVTMQNGVRSDRDAADILGRDRIVGCVMLRVPARWLRCKTSRFKPLRGYRLHTNVQAGRPAARLCPDREQACRATELLFGSGLFRFQGGLTVSRHARNIVCIRMNKITRRPEPRYQDTA